MNFRSSMMTLTEYGVATEELAVARDFFFAKIFSSNIQLVSKSKTRSPQCWQSSCFTFSKRWMHPLTRKTTSWTTSVTGPFEHKGQEC